ncbi:MAG TPA: hypothetical protein VEW94_14100 [Chloroflexia bacterium]|nr:hypothetical protein [Chloroflexia bacterium]
MTQEHLGSWDTSCWYGYDIYKSLDADAVDPIRVVIFSKDNPPEETVGHIWHVSISYEAWFATEDEAKASTEAFIDEMHWKREAEWNGIGKKLAEQRSEEIRIAAEEYRKKYEEETQPQVNS